MSQQKLGLFSNTKQTFFYKTKKEKKSMILLQILYAVLSTGYIEGIMQGKCGRNTETTFDIK